MKFTIKNKLILTLCVPLLIMGGYFIYSLIDTENDVLSAEKENVKTQLSTMFNENLQGQVDTLTLSISDYYERSKLENLKQSLRKEMMTFKKTISGIYEKSDSYIEAQKSVYAFLNNYRWGNGRYLFAYDASSYDRTAHATKPQVIGTNAYDSKDTNGKYYVRDIVSSAKNNEVGFTEYVYENPLTKQLETKLSASFYFKPMDMVVATGEYVSTLQKGMYDAALQAVINAKYGKNGYFWIQDTSGKILAHPKSEIIGKTLGSTSQVAKDIQGKADVISISSYENPSTKQTETKIIYARKIFSEWGWVVATGAYASDIDAVQDKLTNATAHIFDKQVNSVTITALVLILFSFIVVIWIISKIIRGLVILRERIDTLSTGEADLTSRIEINSNDELSDIGNSVNNFIKYLQSMMLDISQATTHITNNIEELNIQSEQNNQALLSHSEETEQVVSAITEMSATSDTVSQNATETSANTQKANDEALQSKEVVTQASNGVIALVDEVESAASTIDTMNQSAQKITEVLTIIGEIAEQTNLLALNAAIEAARAGEQGRGFAVVADEVRSLAARTQDSTSEIDVLLATLRDNASKAVSAMDKTKASCERTAENTAKVTDSLDNVTNFIVEINDLSTQIATAAEEQSAVSEEVNKNMNNIHNMVQELTENGQASVDSTQNLSSANEQLTALVSKFKLA